MKFRFSYAILYKYFEILNLREVIDMEIVLTVLEAIASLALIVVVLLQSGKKSGLSGAIAGGSETYMSKGKSGSFDQMLADSTKWIALVWVVLTLALSLV